MNKTRFPTATVNDLRLFLTVCDVGSFTLTGTSFGLSQPGVSRTKRKLEQRASQPLFVRTGRGVIPTKIGDLLRGFSQAQIASVEDLENALDRLKNAHPSEVTMVLPSRIGRLLIPPLVTILAARWSEVTLRIEAQVPSTIPISVQNAAFDFGIAYEPDLGSAQTGGRFARETLWLVGSSNHIASSFFARRRSTLAA